MRGSWEGLARTWAGLCEAHGRVRRGLGLAYARLQGGVSAA